MNKTRNKSKLLALTIAMALILIVSAVLVACNKTGGQDAMKVITFDFNDGTGNTFEKVLNIEESISYTPPTREGYDFVGWTFDKGGENAFDASKAETASFTLYAQWKIKTYTVYFFLYEGEDPISTQTVDWGESALAPSEETIAQNLKVGDIFVKWTESFDNVKSDAYVYAEVSKIECTVKFTDGENVIKTATGTFGDKITLPSDNENPTKNGYKFAGWYDEKCNQATAETTFSGDKTYYAKWTIDAPQQPTVNKDFEITYGEKANLTASISEKIEGIAYTYEWFENGVSIAKGESANIDKLGAGEHVIRCSVTASDGTQTSNAKSSFVTVTVKKATLSATIAQINITYGDNLPVLSVQYTGFKYDDDQSAIDTANLQWDTAYTQASGVGEYTISASGFESDKYDVSFVQSKIVVGKKDVTAKSALAFGKKYDGSTLSKTYCNESFDGVLNGHVLKLVLKTSASGVGEYSLADNMITSTLTIVDEEGKNVAANYNVTFTATASISLATINSDDYTVPTSEENTFTFDNQSHGEAVKSYNFDVTYSLEQDGEYTAAQPHFTDAGEYTVYYTVSRKNYKSVSGSYVVTINKVKLDITIKNQETVYGEAFSFDKTLYSVSGNDYNLLSYTLACAYEVGNPVGSYPIVLTIGAKSETRSDATQNFDFTMNSATLTVNKVALSVTVKPVSVTYGETLALDINDLVTVSGLYSADDIADIIALTTDYAADNRHVVGGEYYVNCALKNNDGNYTLADDSTVKAQVTVTMREISVKMNNITVIYGEKLGKCTFTITGGSIVEGDDVNEVVICQSDYSAENGNYTLVGQTEISATSGNGNYTVTAESGIIEITKRPTILKLDSAGQTRLLYGKDTSNYFAKNNMILSIDDKNGLDAPIEKRLTVSDKDNYSFSLVRGRFGTDPEEVYTPGMIGSFELRAVPTTDYLKENYEFTVTSAEIKVTARPFTLSMTNKFAYKVGEVATFDIASAATPLYNGDVIEGTISTITDKVGVYTFEDNDKQEDFEALFVMNGFKVTNKNGDDVTEYYTISYSYFTINIEIAEISIDHNVNSLTTFSYDGTAHCVQVKNIEEGASITYSVDNQNWGVVAPAFTNAGTYTVYYKLSKTIEGIVNPITYEDSYTVKIDKANAYINLRNQTMTFGDALNIDQTAYTAQGFFNGDEKLVTVEIYVSNYDAEHVGSYNVCANLTYNGGNYNCHWNGADLIVSARQVKLVQNENSKYTVVYGKEVGAFDSYKIVDDNGNEYESARQYIVFSHVYSVGCGVGSYAVNASAKDNNFALCNYEVVDCDISVVVLPRPIAVKTKNVTSIYGQEINLAYEIVSGTLYDNDTLAAYFDFDQKNVGNYTVTPTFDSLDETNRNYDITAQSGVVTITKATLTVSLSRTQTITYGEAMPSYEFAYSGFAYSETAADFEFPNAYACDYNSAKRAGTFDVTIVKFVLDNYDIVYVNSKLIVNKATLNLNAVAHDAITYGDDVPTDFAYEVYGFVNGDDKSLLDGKATFTTNYTKGADANVTKYTFNVVCEELDNYSVNYGNAQTLVVNKANYTKEQVDAALANVNLTGTYEYGKTLAAYSLMGTGFEWVDANKLVTCDKNDAGYSARYCKDKTNYNVYTGVVIKITLAKVNAQFHFDGEFGARWTGSAIDYAGIIAGTASPEGVSVASLVRGVQGWDPTFSYSLIAPTGKTQMIDGGIYTVRVSASETTNYNAAYIDIPFSVYAAQLNSEYYTVEGALAKATSGKTVYLVGNAFISKSVTVPSGVTLIVGLKTANYSKTAGSVSVDNDYVVSGESPMTTASYAWNSVGADYTLTINNGITITIGGGNIIVAGRLGSTTLPFEGHTSGAYSKIVNNGNIVLNSGKFDVRGLVNGSGQATFNGGNVYSPFVVRDFKGGSYTVYKAWDAAMLIDSWTNRVAPFSEYEMPNIQCNSRYYSGSKLTGYADLWASDKHNTTTIDAISSSGILQITNGGYIDKSYNASTEVTTLTFVGTATMGSLDMEVQGITASMSKTYFPIPWTYNISIGNGTTATTLNAGYKYKIMPGAIITVRTNGKLSSTGNLIVYSNFTDTNSIRVYPVSKGKAATLIIDGGTFEATAFGGIVQGTGKGGTAKVTSTLSVTAYEHNNSNRYKVTEAARLADGTSMTKGTTYTL